MQAPNKHFSIFLSKAMQSCNFTQAQLAERSETTQTTISRYLSGKASPKAEELLRISQALGVSMEWLLTGNGTQKSQESANPSAQSKKSAVKALKDARAALDRIEKELDPGS